jgi:hypothetical protein
VKRFVAALMLVSGLLVAGGANATVIYQSSPGSGSGSPLDSSTARADLITPASSGTVNSITISAESSGSPSGVLTVSICQSVSSQPSNCVPFTQQGAISPNVYGPATYTDNTGFQITANQPFWVVFGATSGGFNIQQTSSGTGYRSNSGGAYFAATNEFVIEISGNLAPAPSAVPTLSEWGQLMLALMVIGIAWHFHNNRQNSF